MFSGDRKIPNRGPTVPVRNEVCRVSHFTVDPVGCDFFQEPQNSNDLFFSHIPFILATYCIIFVDDVTELMFTVNDTRCTKSA